MINEPGVTNCTLCKAALGQSGVKRANLGAGTQKICKACTMKNPAGAKNCSICTAPLDGPIPKRVDQCTSCFIKQKKNGNFECEMCFAMMKPVSDDSLCLLCEDYNKGYVCYKIKKCNTLLHLECYMEHINTALQQRPGGVPILCPNPECGKAGDGGELHYLNCETDSLARTCAGKLEKQLRDKLQEC